MHCPPWQGRIDDKNLRARNTDFECAYKTFAGECFVSTLKICVASTQSFVVNSPMHLAWYTKTESAYIRI